VSVLSCNAIIHCDDCIVIWAVSVQFYVHVDAVLCYHVWNCGTGLSRTFCVIMCGTVELVCLAHFDPNNSDFNQRSKCDHNMWDLSCVGSNKTKHVYCSFVALYLWSWRSCLYPQITVSTWMLLESQYLEAVFFHSCHMLSFHFTGGLVAFSATGHHN
jgi:hypothetical protein